MYITSAQTVGQICEVIPMYDELTGNLRAQATHFSVHDETSLLLLKAADAIEDLSKTLDEEVEINTALECNMPVWIPVTERLPEEEEVVLVFGGASVYTAKRHNKYGELMWWKLNSRWHYCNPTHWMPLPEPPKDGES